MKVKILDAATGAEVGTIAGATERWRSTRRPGRSSLPMRTSNQQKIYVYNPTGGTALRSFGGRARPTASSPGSGTWSSATASSTPPTTPSRGSRRSRRPAPSSASGAVRPRAYQFGTRPASRRRRRPLVRRRREQRPHLGLRPGRPEAGVPVRPADVDHHLACHRHRDRRADGRVRARDRRPRSLDGRGSVRDESTGLWWDPARRPGRPRRRGVSRRSEAPRPTLSGRWTFPGPQYGRTYHVEARARDADNTISSPVGRSTCVSSRPDAARARHRARDTAGRIDRRRRAGRVSRLRVRRHRVSQRSAGDPSARLERQYWGGTGWVADEILLPG